MEIDRQDDKYIEDKKRTLSEMDDDRHVLI